MFHLVLYSIGSFAAWKTSGYNKVVPGDGNRSCQQTSPHQGDFGLLRSLTDLQHGSPALGS